VFPPDNVNGNPAAAKRGIIIPAMNTDQVRRIFREDGFLHLGPFLTERASAGYASAVCSRSEGSA
jgi:hypothetical protein